MLSRYFLALPLAVSAPLAGALAHTVFVAPAPQFHVSSNHQSFGGFHGRTGSGYGRPGTRTVINGQVVFVGGYDPGGMMRDGGGATDPVLDTPVPSDAERYRAATGASLPPSHAMIVLPPTTPRGDVTYLWSTTGEN